MAVVAVVVGSSMASAAVVNGFLYKIYIGLGVIYISERGKKEKE